jgi:hypothetical protein
MREITATASSLVTAGAIICLVLVLLLVPRAVPNVGAVTGVGVDVYWDFACTDAVTSINWGTIEPGETRNYTLYIANNEAAPVTLSIDYSNWNPASASSYTTPSWNCTNYNLNSGSVATALLSLTVSPYASGITDFTFDMAITGAEIQQPSTLQILIPKIMQDPTQTVYYVRTGNIYDDSSLGFVYGKSTQVQNIISQNSTYINQTSGRPLISGDVVIFGGKYPNKVTKYYEREGFAVVWCDDNSTYYTFKRVDTGQVIFTVATSTYNQNVKDYFVIQAFKDGNRTVLCQWGIGALGTYASGLCFADLVWPHIADYGGSYYIYCWQDLNGDGIQDTNEISLITSGS